MTNYFDYKRLSLIKFKMNRRKVRTTTKATFDSIITFDIETSNGYVDDSGVARPYSHDMYEKNPQFYSRVNKVSLLYVWQLAIDDGKIHVFMGRTWGDFRKFLDMLTNKVFAQFQNDKLVIPIYIHNLGFEFQHLRNCIDEEFKQEDAVFAREARKPMRVRFRYETSTSSVIIEFRDTLCLTQKSLDQWCQDEDLPIKKLHEPDGYYDEIRTPLTELTDEEYKYQVNDVVSMIHGIRKYKEKFGSLDEIPMTQTGIVRQKCEKALKTNKEWTSSQQRVTDNMPINVYKDLLRAYAGGWTHANSHYVNKVVENGLAYDFASSYPAAMCMFSYPKDEWFVVDPSDYDYYLSLNTRDYIRPYVYYLHITCKNVKAKTKNTFWSSSRGDVDWLKEVQLGKDLKMDNGRIYEAKEYRGVMTDLDWSIFQRAYTMSDYTIDYMYAAEASPLPRELVKLILKYYQYKTTLKGNDAMKSKYTESKQFINSIYGMAVTRIISDEIGYNGKWVKDKLDTTDKYYERRDECSNIFLAYPVGVWVAAYARNNLWELILQLDERVVYGDTDSLKGPFTKEDVEIINDYNDWIELRQSEVIKHLRLFPNAFTPKTPKGVVKSLGVFEEEEPWLEFKTLGAKRYACTYLKEDGTTEVKLTVAGLPKRATKKVDTMAKFNNHTHWTNRESFKKTHVYNDNQGMVKWIDRDGKGYISNDKFGICIVPTSFDMSMTDEFEAFCNVIQGGTSTNPFNILNK